MLGFRGGKPDHPVKHVADAGHVAGAPEWYLLSLLSSVAPPAAADVDRGLVCGSGWVDAGTSARRKRPPDLQRRLADMPGIPGAGCWVWFPDVEAI